MSHNLQVQTSDNKIVIINLDELMQMESLKNADVFMSLFDVNGNENLHEKITDTGAIKMFYYLDVSAVGHICIHF